VTALGPARGIAALMSTISFEKAASVTERDPNARKAFEMMGSAFDLKSLDLSGAAKARPFVSPMVWATFSALQAVVMHAVMRWHVLKGGLGNKDFTDNEAIAKLIKIALPYYSEYIDKFGPSAYYYVIEALDEQLLMELQSRHSGAEADKATLSRLRNMRVYCVRESNG